MLLGGRAPSRSTPGSLAYFGQLISLAQIDAAGLGFRNGGVGIIGPNGQPVGGVAALGRCPAKGKGHTHQVDRSAHNREGTNAHRHHGDGLACAANALKRPCRGD